ncbi:MAG TPA: hypothetical protein VGB45_15860, partial [Abditibacterium sp.]
MKFSACIAVCLVAVAANWNGLPPARAAEITPEAFWQQILVDLVSPDSDKVHSAVGFVMARPKRPAQVVPLVLPLLQIGTNDYKDNSRLSSLSELMGFYGPDAKAAIPRLIVIASNAKQDWVRDRTRNALIKIGPNDERVFAALSASLRNPPGPTEEIASARALARMGPIATRAIPQLNRQILACEKESPSRAYGISSARLYEPLGTIALKKAALPSPAAAMKTLRNVGQVAPGQSILAFLSLQKSGKKAEAAIPLLLSIIERDEEFLQSAAIDTLGFIGAGTNRRITQILLDIVERGNRQNNIRPKFLAIAAQNSLIRFAPRAGGGVPVLAAALRSQNAGVRLVAAQALANNGSATVPATAGLTAALRATNEKTYDVEWQHLIDLSKVIGEVEVLDTILELLDPPRNLAGANGLSDSRVRANLWITVASILTRSDAKIDDSKRRAIAARVLPILQTPQPNEFLMVGITRVIGALGESAIEAVPHLIEIIQPDGWKPTFRVWESGGMIGHGYVASTTVPLEAIQALGQIGKAAAPALPILETIAAGKGDRSSEYILMRPTAEVAREAIQKIKAALEK